MEMSQSIAKLAEALSKAQAEITGAKKTTENTFFKVSYADLSSVWDACKEPLSKNGLCVSQGFEICDDGVIVITILAHSSGEWIKGKMKIIPTKKDPQGMGSAATYARRYSLAAIVGVCPEDDDGEAAMGRKDEKKDEKKSAQVADRQGAAASSKSSPAPPKKADFFEVMEQERKRVGDENYFAMLGTYGYEKAPEIPEGDQRVQIYKALKALHNKEEVSHGK